MHRVSCICLLLAAQLGLAGMVVRDAAADWPQASRGAPPRDARESRAGTAQIAGSITAVEGSAPLRRVQVRLSSSAFRGERITRTDGDGRYRFTGLPPGTYRLQVSKPGYVPLPYGVTDPLEPGRPIELRAREVISNANFTLPRAAVISGRVVDEFGEPILDAEVRALRHQIVRGERRLTTASRVRPTDDLGGFRIFGLLPGSYYVSVVPRAAERGTEGDGTGAYLPTYYPGTVDLAQAQRITVQFGEESPNVLIALVSARAVRVRGAVVDSEGRPAAGAIVTPLRREATQELITMAETRTRGDGTFELSNLAPGSYSLQASISSLARTREPEFGAVPLEVGDADLEGVTVATSKGATLRGRVILNNDGIARLFRSSLVGISARPASQDARYPMGRGSAVRVKEDWTFELSGLIGPRVIRVTGLPSPWALESLSLDGNDVTDMPIELRNGEVTDGLQVVVTSLPTEVVGTVVRLASQSARLVSVIVFAADSSQWGLQSRYIQMRRPDASGQFRVRGLPPGRYLAVAVPYLSQGEWTNPEFLERAQAVATGLTLSPAGKTTLQLKLTAVP